MREKQILERSEKRYFWSTAGFISLLIVSLGISWQTVVQTDLKMRTDLLQQARVVAQAIDLKRLRNLTGTTADLTSPDYQSLKQQLIAIGSANPGCKWFYLMGRKADGAIFFFADSESPEVEDATPPGEVYADVPADYRRVFDTKTESVEGPVADRWGKWISALVPLTDPKTGEVFSVLGMDIDARLWNLDLAAKTALPLGILLVLLIGASVLFATTRRVHAIPKPIRQRLLPPLAIMVALLLAGAGTVLWQQHRQRLAAEIAADIADVSGDLRGALEQQTVNLKGCLQPVAANTMAQKSLREGDAERLLADWQPMFERLHTDTQLSHFYFIDTNRVCLLRIHNPDHRGDLINRFTLREAERTRKTASGLELGTRGDFTLRVVQPVFTGKRFVGYVELGKEIEDILHTMHLRSATQIAMVIRKEYLNRTRWEESMRRHGREADWDRLPRSVISYTSQSRLPDAFAAWADQFADGQAHGETAREIVTEGKRWRVSAIPLPDASGKGVGDLLILRDITAEMAAFVRLTTVAGTAGVILLVLLLGIIYVLLHRTDAGIMAQQAALKESEHTLRESQIIAGLGSYVLDIPSGIWRSSDVLDKMFGIDNSYEHSVAGWLALIHPGDRVMMDEYFRDHVLCKGGDFNKTYRIIRHDNQMERWVQGIGVLEKDSKGHPLKLRGTIQDITERKQAKDALQASEARYRAILKASPDTIVITDLKGRIVMVSPGAVPMFGCDWEEELLGCLIADFIVPEDRDLVASNTILIFQGTPPGPTEYLGLRKDGSTFDMEVNGERLLNEEGQPLQMVSIIRDVTERKQSVRTLRQSEARLRTLVNNIPHKIFIKDRNLCLISVNENFASQFGLHPEDVIGKNDYDLFPKELAHQHREDDRCIMRNGRAEEFEKKYIQNGREVWLHVIKAPVRDELGEVTGVFGLFWDITERKQAEEKHEQMEAQLRQSQKMEAVGQLAGGISHDFKNILQIILGFSSMLLAKTGEESSERKWLIEIQNAARRATAMIRQLMDFSRKTSANLCRVEPNETIREAKNLLQPLLGADYRQNYVLEPGLQPVWADSGQLLQVIMNLAINARDAMPSGGTLTIQTSNAVIGEQELTTMTGARAGSFVCISVSDTGIGLCDEVKKHLFEPFFTTKGMDGTGLGLAVVYGIVQQHKGWISISGQEGQGATFSIYLPAAESGPSSENSPKAFI